MFAAWVSCMILGLSASIMFVNGWEGLTWTGSDAGAVLMTYNLVEGEPEITPFATVFVQCLQLRDAISLGWAVQREAAQEFA